MENSGKIEIDKFNGQNFELWKIKMEDMLVDKYQWITIDLGTKLMAMSAEYWVKLDQKENSTIRFCISDSVLLNDQGKP